jgi:hypothetical protein
VDDDDRGRRLVIFEALVDQQFWKAACEKVADGLETRYKVLSARMFSDAFSRPDHWQNVTSDDVFDAHLAHKKVQDAIKSIYSLEIYIEFAISIRDKSFNRHWAGYILSTGSGEEKFIEDSAVLTNIYDNTLDVDKICS